MTRAERDRLFLAASSIAVLAAVILGLLRLGPPQRQREMRADRKRISDLYRIALAIEQPHPLAGGSATIPKSLEELRRSAPNVAIADPVNGEPYEFRAAGERSYELCAVFQHPSDDVIDGSGATRDSSFWQHPAGKHCFTLETNGSPVPYPGYFDP